MSKTYNDNLRSVRRLTNEMLALADKGDSSREDVSCGIIYGILRDAAYRLRRMVDDECDRHEEEKKWD